MICKVFTVKEKSGNVAFLENKERQNFKKKRKDQQCKCQKEFKYDEDLSVSIRLNKV